MNITGLLEACEGPELHLVRAIIENWGDINATATYHLRCKTTSTSIPIEGASALFVAAGNCNFELVKYLVGKGANVNSRTANPYCIGDERNKFAGMSPLHASICLRPEFEFDQRKPIIEFLIANGGDPLALTSLGISFWELCYQEEIEAQLLVEFGQSLGKQFPGKNCGALHHWASSCGFSSSPNQNPVPTFELLLAEGADVRAVDEYGLTPLNVAALSCRDFRYGNANMPVLRHLLSRDEFTLLEKIDALELAGAMTLSFLGESEVDDEAVSRAFLLWNEALNLRGSASEPIPKIPLNKSNNLPWRTAEWTTRYQLQELQNATFDAMKIQAILLGTRIISRISFDAFVFYVWTRGLMVQRHCLILAIDSLTFSHRIIELLDICFLTLEVACILTDSLDDKIWGILIGVYDDLVFSLEQLKNEQNPILNPETLIVSLELVLDTIQSYLYVEVENRPYFTRVFWTNLEPSGLSMLGYDGCPRLSNRVYQPMFTIFHLVSLLSVNPEMVPHEIKCHLHRFVKRDDRDEFGYNLLLLACLLPNNVSTLAAFRLLLEVGADPNAVLESGDSPLHLVATSMGEQERDSPLANLLLECGAHPDHVNAKGETPLEVWKKSHEKPGTILLPPSWTYKSVLPLACLSAGCIQRSKIPYKKLPKSLHKFVGKH